MFEKLKSYFRPIKTNRDKLPETFDEAVEYIVQRTTSKDLADPRFHFTGGMAMRNGLRLWELDNPLVKDMHKRFGLIHADDLSGLLTEAATAKLEGKSYDPNPTVERYKKHWINHGYDPGTMGKIDHNSVKIL